MIHTVFPSSFGHALKAVDGYCCIARLIKEGAEGETRVTTLTMCRVGGRPEESQRRYHGRKSINRAQVSRKHAVAGWDAESNKSRQSSGPRCQDRRPPTAI